MAGWSEQIGAWEKPLFEGAARYDADMIRWALRNGANASARDGDGGAAMHALGSSARAMAEDGDGATPEAVECVGLLLAAGCGLDDRDSGGRTPLEVAVARRKDIRAAEALAAAGASLLGAMSAAAEFAGPEMLAMLWRRGASPSEPDASGITPMQAAVGRWVRQPLVEEFLQEAILAEELRADPEMARKPAAGAARL